MPSGKVHDTITLVTAAAATPLWWVAYNGRQPEAFAVTVGAYIFSGLWLSHDLDTNSVCYQRWGPLKFLWWPYCKFVPHRSWISHGIAAPILRVVYFIAALWAAISAVLWFLARHGVQVQHHGLVGALFRHGLVWTFAHPTITLWVLTGLVLGGIAHSTADAVVSFAKRVW